MPHKSNGAIKRSAGALVRAITVAALVAFGALVLPAAAAAATGISGRVTDATTSEVISSAEVCAFETSSETVVECTASNGSGTYELLGLAEGSYKVRFHKTGYATQWYLGQATWSSATAVPVTSGFVTSGTDASLMEEGRGSISGRVTAAANGRGVSGVEVCAFSLFGECAETNGNGEYTLSSLEPGTYSVYFFPQYNACEEEHGVKVRCALSANLLSGSVSGVQVKASQTVHADVTLQAGGQITGTVTNASLTHPGLAKLEVSATRVNGKGESECCGFGYAWTNPSGSYTISGLPSGSYKVFFNGEVCTVPANEKQVQCTIVYVGDWYHEKAGYKPAEAVNVTAGQVTAGINENLREAFPAVPASVAAPTLTGQALVGGALTCSQGSWSHEPTYLVYQWLRDGGVITGQAGSSYTVQAADAGHSIACSVWAGNGAGVVSASSNTVTIGQPLATAIGAAKVKGHLALLKLTCSGGGACSGTLELTVRMRHKRHVKTVVIGSARYSLPAGATATVRVHLTNQGVSLLRKAGTRGIRAKLLGTGVKPGTVSLKAAKGTARKGKKR